MLGGGVRSRSAFLVILTIIYIHRYLSKRKPVSGELTLFRLNWERRVPAAVSQEPLKILLLYFGNIRIIIARSLGFPYTITIFWSYDVIFMYRQSN